MKKARAESRLPYFFSVTIVVSLLLLLSGCQPQGDDIQEPASTVKITYGLYDNFDGQGCLQNFDDTFKAEAGLLSTSIWKAFDYNSSKAFSEFPVIMDDAAHGYVCRMTPNIYSMYYLYLCWPEKIEFSNELTQLACSYDFKVISLGGDGCFSFHFGQKGIHGYKSGWFGVRISLGYDHAGPCIESWGKNSHDQPFTILDESPISYNVWYNLKVEILKTGANDFKINLYLNNILLGTQTVLDWLLLDSEWPIFRYFNPGHNMYGIDYVAGEMLIDNVYAEYNNKTKI